MSQGKLDYDKLVSGLPQGIMGLGPGGEVLSMNPAAGRILGIDPAQAAGRQFSQVFADRLEQGEELYKTIDSAQVKGRSISGLVIPLGEGERSHIALTVTPLADGDTAVMLVDVSRQEQHRHHQQKKHDQATSWALRLEQEKTRLEQMLKRNARLRLWVALALLLIFAGLGFYVWSGSNLVSYVESKFHTGEQATDPEGVYTVQPGPLKSSINLSGSIEPYETISLLSPFAGRILERHFEYGQRVKKGASLLKLDTSDLELKLRDARVEAIKAREEFAKLEDWKNSTTVLQAQRELNKAKNDLDVTQQKLHESEMLYKRGIIPLDEYRSLKEQVLNQGISISNLKDQLRLAKEKGQRKNLLMARLQMENANEKLAKIKNHIKKASITAPVVGVVIRPSKDSGGKKGLSVDVGFEATKGQVLLALGNLEQLSVSTTVGELNVAKLRKGQKVAITSFAFPDLVLEGKIDSVSSQANQEGGDGPPTFQVRVVTGKLTPEQQEKLRLGMTTDLEVVVYENPKALTVPIEAVHPGPKGGNAVTVLHDGQDDQEVPVKTGITTQDRVEITEGLKAGDKVSMPIPSSPVSSPQPAAQPAKASQPSEPKDK